MDPYENLANHIVLQAVKDYRRALEVLDNNPDSKDGNRERTSIERFFRSSWFGVLTTLDGELLIRRLREEAR